MITHVIVELKHPVKEEYFPMDTVLPSEYYGYGTPVIMCKDCKHWYKGLNINYCRIFYDNDLKLYKSSPDDFCSVGERRE